jgi:hypothetical protein
MRELTTWCIKIKIFDYFIVLLIEGVHIPMVKLNVTYILPMVFRSNKLGFNIIATILLPDYQISHPHPRNVNHLLILSILIVGILYYLSS